MSNPELKPCPFCGGSADFCDTDIHWVKCERCGAESGDTLSGTMEAAAQLWNKRDGALYVDINASDMEPVKGLLGALSNNFDELPKQVKEKILEITEAGK